MGLSLDGNMLPHRSGLGHSMMGIKIILKQTGHTKKNRDITVSIPVAQDEANLFNWKSETCPLVPNMSTVIQIWNMFYFIVYHKLVIFFSNRLLFLEYLECQWHSCFMFVALQSPMAALWTAPYSKVELCVTHASCSRERRLLWRENVYNDNNNNINNNNTFNPFTPKSDQIKKILRQPHQ